MIVGVAKMLIQPIAWYGAGRHPTRRTWVATLVLDDGSEQSCAHTRGGHRTTEQAIACGRALTKRLDRGVPSSND